MSSNIIPLKIIRGNRYLEQWILRILGSFGFVVRIYFLEHHVGDIVNKKKHYAFVSVLNKLIRIN